MKNRLLIELETHRKAINRDIINPLVPELSLDDLKPLLTLVARARADYVKTLLDLPALVGESVPEVEHIKELRNKRIIFEELVDAVNALETVIQREYMDVKSKPKNQSF